MIENVSALGVPVTSDPDEIKRFLLESDGGIVFSTYQSSPLVEESQRSPEVPAFDIAFADEAHRCAGKVSSAFGSILDDQKIRSKKRLFMTATPRVLSKQIKKKADDENINLACMDDVSQFGEVFHQLNFSEAIEKELLSDYLVVIIGVDDPSVQAKILDRMIVDTGNEFSIDTETLANHIALAKAIKDYDLSRMITFHSRVKSAKKFSEDHPLILDWIPKESKSSKSAMTSYVSGEMNAKNRNTEINKLRNISEQEVGILANARCLSEGVDVPTLDGIAFFDPRSSQVDIIQAVGRAIRKSENKTDGFKKNEYTLDIEKSLMTRIFIYDKKTYKKYRLNDINTKKENSITRFIYKEDGQFLTDKLGYPQFYTQLVFEKDNPNVMIKSVINNEAGITNLAKCKKIETFQSKS